MTTVMFRAELDYEPSPAQKERVLHALRRKLRPVGGDIVALYTDTDEGPFEETAFREERLGSSAGRKNGRKRSTENRP